MIKKIFFTYFFLHVIYIAFSGETIILSSWGQNDSGQLGDGTNTNRNTPVSVDTSGVLNGKRIISIYSGNYYGIVKDSNGKLYSWGHNIYGELANGTFLNSNSPVLVDMSGVLKGKNISLISTGGVHNLVYDTNGTLYSWGYNLYGEVGDGTKIDKNTPVLVDMNGVLKGKKISLISCGDYHSLVVDTNYTLYSWGYNKYGQLGDGTNTDRSTPVLVDMNGVLKGKKISIISTGSYHNLVSDENGMLFSWGYNLYGILGDGTTSHRNTPVLVDMSGVLNGKKISLISTGLEHNLLLDSNGILYSWGRNNKGQIGDGTYIDRTSPVAVDMSGVLNGKKISLISVGVNHNLITDSAGAIYSWGENNNGQLGDGTRTNRNTPVLVNRNGLLNNTSTSLISAGYGISLALSVKCDPGYYGEGCSLTKCYGILSNEKNVCSSHGNCIAPDNCVCNSNYNGKQCENQNISFSNKIQLNILIILILVNFQLH